VLTAHRGLLALLTFPALLAAQDHRAPAGSRPANRKPNASILPGGRIIAPTGARFATGPGAFGLAVSASGKAFATANGGPGVNSITVLERDKNGRWQLRQLNARGSDDDVEGDWRGVSLGLAFSGERAVFASEGNTGRIILLDWAADRRRTIELNRGSFKDSYSGDLAFDASAGLLYAADQANFRVAVIETRSRQAIASVPVGRLPFALALSPDRRKLYVTNAGMFQYRPIPGADPLDVRGTGLPFPAFGFPSPEAANGARRTTGRGPVEVPGLGDPNARESNSLCVVDVSDPSAPKVEAFVPTGVPFGEESAGGSSPSGVVATADYVFVSNANDDSITVIDAHTNHVDAEIPIRIPGLERLRGALPVGMAYQEDAGRLLVAEAGINAVGVIDVKGRRVLGHIPVGWFPTRVALSGGEILVANARGEGAGPNDPDHAQPRQGSVSIFPPPGDAELAADTDFVMRANGFRELAGAPPPLPTGIRRVVLIVKENRTYDEVLGDIPEASNGPAMWAPALARLGTRGFVDGRRQRLSIKDINVTPNHHAIAGQWVFSDNFYADSEVSVDGHHWLVGAYPNAWTESSLQAAYSPGKKEFRLGDAPGRLIFAGSNASVHPEEQEQGGTIWHHFARHGVSFLNFGEGFELAGVDEGKDLLPTGARYLTNVPMPEPLYSNTSRQYPGFNMNIPDQYRAAQFIREIDERFVKTGAELPRFLFIHLPNDHMAGARPEDGYPYEESFVADNDLALGRILEYLSGTKWWKEMAVFVTEDDPQGGVDHVDAHRTVLLGAGPWFKRNYVSHTNTSFPGLLKTIFRLLGLPPLNLFDATAADLSDCFVKTPDLAGYRAKEVDKRLFDPAVAKEGDNPASTPRMDDPEEIRRQRR
jgi:YVTN family beta-propeller protein